MNPLLHAISTLSAALAGSLVSAIWEGAILVLGVALCLRILPDLSAGRVDKCLSAVAVFAFLLFNGQPSPEWKGISGFPFPPRSNLEFCNCKRVAGTHSLARRAADFERHLSSRIGETGDSYSAR